MISRALATAALFAMLVPIAACGDDDDSTGSAEATSSATPAPADPADPADPAEEEAIKTAWTTVFDSAVPVPDKLGYLADPAAAEPVLTAYAGAGRQVGGISFAAESVAVQGNTAQVTYDVTFAGNPVYQDLQGALERGGDRWVVGQAQFCEVMASARTPCP